MAPIFSPVFSEKDLMELPNWNAYARLQIDGSFLQAFNFAARMDDAPYDKELASHIRTLSRLKYGTDVSTVDAQISKRRSCWKS